MQLSFKFFFAEARGKLKKLLVPILLALKFKSAVILPIVFTILTLVSIKALKVGLVALVLAGKFFRLKNLMFQLFFFSFLQDPHWPKTSSPRNKKKSQPLTSQPIQQIQDSTLKLWPTGIATVQMPEVIWLTMLTIITQLPKITKHYLKMFNPQINLSELFI